MSASDSRGPESRSVRAPGTPPDESRGNIAPGPRRRMGGADRDHIALTRRDRAGSRSGEAGAAKESCNGRSSPKESGKVLLIRRSSESDMMGGAHAAGRSVQLVLLAAALALSVHSIYYIRLLLSGPTPFDLGSASWTDQVLLVWCSGWITAASTGLGTLPFLCFTKPSGNAVAACNAIAAGMMMAASIGLVAEGCLEETTPETVMLPALRVLFGLYLGVAFVKGSSHFLGNDEPTDLLAAPGLNTRRVLIIMAVMTLHSFSEGVGIGVSYHSQSLGGFVSATLAIHNIPEGLAIAIVLIPRGFSLLSTTLWCIFSSLPQPLMAVPAYLFTQQFKFVLPIGLGLAGGAMGVVVLTELLPEALEALPAVKVYTIAFLSMLFMGLAQVLIRESSLFL